MGKLDEALLPLIRANYVPDFLLRAGIRSLLASMASAQAAVPWPARVAATQAYAADLRTRALAESTQAANEQHYEVPAAFYAFVMGTHRKYSCGIWPADAAAPCSLDESEAAALALVCERAGLSAATRAGARVLDMGCGWGSFSLYAAARFPQVKVTGVSNSASQRAFILGEAAKRGLTNLDIVTADINAFDGAGGAFDFVVSIEMMEHGARGWGEWGRARVAVGRVSHNVPPPRALPQSRTTSCCSRASRRGWRPAAPSSSTSSRTRTRPSTTRVRRAAGRARAANEGGAAYPPSPSPSDGWMAKTFFSGGQMPSDDLLLHFQRDVVLTARWVVPGWHYERTCNEWLRRMDAHKAEVVALLEGVYGAGTGLGKYVDWRLFFLACAELFGFNGGNEWAVSHYTFTRR
jgi:cyclopropane-fatty-acyl-phospholipid synthase